MRRLLLVTGGFVGAVGLVLLSGPSGAGGGRPLHPGELPGDVVRPLAPAAGDPKGIAYNVWHNGECKPVVAPVRRELIMAADGERTENVVVDGAAATASLGPEKPRTAKTPPPGVTC